MKHLVRTSVLMIIGICLAASAHASISPAEANQESPLVVSEVNGLDPHLFYLSADLVAKQPDGNVIRLKRGEGYTPQYLDEMLPNSVDLLRRNVIYPGAIESKMLKLYAKIQDLLDIDAKAKGVVGADRKVSLNIDGSILKVEIHGNKLRGTLRTARGEMYNIGQNGSLPIWKVSDLKGLAYEKISKSHQGVVGESIPAEDINIETSVGRGEVDAVAEGSPSADSMGSFIRVIAAKNAMLEFEASGKTAYRALSNGERFRLGSKSSAIRIQLTETDSVLNFVYQGSKKREPRKYAGKMALTIYEENSNDGSIS